MTFKNKIEIISNYTNSGTFYPQTFTACDNTLIDQMKNNILLVDNVVEEYYQHISSKKAIQ
jgi:hypothetical protein